MTESSASASSDSDPHSLPAIGELLNLGDAELHLWLCRREAAADSDTFKRSVLSRYAPIAPSDWQFALGEHGKPRIVAATSTLEFNLSHSRDWLACAVGTASLGVDLEYCDEHRDVMKLARRFFCAGEVAAFEGCEGALQLALFYDLWTLKEAAVKARGEALAPGLQSRGFELGFTTESPMGPGSIAASFPATREHAHYYLLDPLPEYRVAICSLDPSPSPPKLRVYEASDTGASIERCIPLRASSWHD